MTDPAALQRSRRRRAGAGVAVVAAVLLGGALVGVPGLGGDTAESADTSAGEASAAAADGKPVAATPSALAAIALEVVGSRPSDFAPVEDEELGDGTVAAELRFGRAGGDPGDLLAVGVAPGRGVARLRCDAPAVTCRSKRSEAGLLTLAWRTAARGADPGSVAVLLQREGEYAIALSTGPEITGDPRDLALDVPVADLVAIVSDSRFGLRTTSDAVEAGAGLASP
ncbi:hypothetical protein [Nocardioides donggukensis]|uniref:Uncharacterized protein n=1 Tax=Nocardioides donggukensis TaxID=2774019 RepID=A0A927K764_9ACTN|nr:hypothetical protein [Nocardioides donggukensis]MBD8868945.1 hypothetical protein [Nocardioides donggukensis]